MKILNTLSILSLAILCNCSVTNKSAKNSAIIYHGRVEQFSPQKANLIGAASIAEFSFKGTETTIYLNSYENHTYVSLELDGVYKGRFRVEKTPQKFVIKANHPGKHDVKLYKATEATNGAVFFDATQTQNIITENTPQNRKKIEFVGNSITSGMGNDLSIPCGKGEWFDQHNAYFSYASILARKLDADFLLSSVSGIGMYRNWNDEHQQEAIMPDVYKNLYLIRENKTPFNHDFQPDLVSIALGTNDLSEGDGKKVRLPFNEEKFVENYIDFIQLIYQRYPKTRIILLTSPMVSGDRNTVLVNALKKVIKNFENDRLHKPIALFQYQPMNPKGCGFHPAIEDDKVMAEELYPTFKKLLDE